MSAFKMRTWMLPVIVVVLSGCGKTENVDKPAAQNGNVSVPARTAMFKPDARLTQPFLEATTQETPDGQLCPPKMTSAGKSVGAMYEQIAGKDGLWQKISFYDANGKRLHYSARLETDLGPITLELWPDVAPNHVRNFIALATVGYYDGLAFDRVVKQPGDTLQPKMELLIGGCPLGTGEPGYGSIGYWLKPEVNEKITHEPGTIGAWHGDVVESAACKFYITLCKAPFMDGYWTAFGRITSGLELARNVFDRPLRESFDDRPAEPVMIRRVIIVTRTQDAL